MNKKPLRLRVLTTYDRKLLQTLAAQDGSVTQFALVGWHLGRDDTWGAMGIGITHIEKLHEDGYVCREGDHVLLDDEQRAFVASLMNQPEEPAERVLYLLYHARRSLRPSEISDMLSSEFFDSLTGALRQSYTAVGASHAVGIILARAKDAGVVSRFDGSNYCLTGAQRAALQVRFPEWNAPAEVMPEAVRSIPGFGRAGRCVELD